MKKLNYLLILFTILLASCGTTKTVMPPESHTIPLSLSKMPASNIYINMDYGIRLNVTDKRANTAVLNKYDVNLFNTARPQVSTYPDIPSFVAESMRQYMQTMGFDLDSDISTDYMLQLEITQFQISLLSGMGWMGTVCFDLQIFDSNRKQVYPRTAITGRTSVNGNAKDFTSAPYVPTG